MLPGQPFLNQNITGFNKWLSCMAIYSMLAFVV